MSQFRRSTVIPYKAPLTEENLPDQSGKVCSHCPIPNMSRHANTTKVFIVTGGNSGVGKELAKILYQHNAHVWIATRSQGRTEEAIAEIQGLYPNSTGQLFFLKLELDDLSTIKASAQQFLSQEPRLDVIWNNAGVMIPPQGSKTVQGYELQQGTNALGHFLFVRFLTPLLIETARSAPRNSVRIVWVSSMSADFAPHPAIDFSNMDYHVDEDAMTKYHRSKAGNLLHAVEFSRRYPDSGIISTVSLAAVNPYHLEPYADDLSSRSILGC